MLPSPFLHSPLNPDAVQVFCSLTWILVFVVILRHLVFVVNAIYCFGFCNLVVLSVVFMYYLESLKLLFSPMILIGPFSGMGRPVCHCWSRPFTFPFPATTRVPLKHVISDHHELSGHFPSFIKDFKHYIPMCYSLLFLIILRKRQHPRKPFIRQPGLMSSWTHSYISLPLSLSGTHFHGHIWDIDNNCIICKIWILSTAFSSTFHLSTALFYHC